MDSHRVTGLVLDPEFGAYGTETSMLKDGFDPGHAWPYRVDYEVQDRRRPSHVVRVERPGRSTAEVAIFRS